MSSGSIDAGESGSVAIVALGSNLGDSVQLLRGAIEELRRMAGGGFWESSLWRSTPVDCPPGSPDFINSVVAFVPRPGETPESLLPKLQAMERGMGRRPKKVLNEARPLDLDIIAFGKETRSSQALTIPHPRAHLRRFVLEPLNEIAPDFLFPGQNRTVRELLAGLPEDEKLTRV